MLNLEETFPWKRFLFVKARVYPVVHFRRCTSVGKLGAEVPTFLVVLDSYQILAVESKIVGSDITKFYDVPAIVRHYAEVGPKGGHIRAKDGGLDPQGVISIGCLVGLV